MQDPSLSIPRQLGACENAIGPTGGEIAAYYWDIESGRKDLAQRGHGADPASLNVPVPRNGGLADLLAAAGNGRPFDAVIVESIDRLSRMTADGPGSSATLNSSTCRCSPPTSRWSPARRRS